MADLTENTKAVVDGGCGISAQHTQAAPIEKTTIQLNYNCQPANFDGGGVADGLRRATAAAHPLLAHYCSKYKTQKDFKNKNNEDVGSLGA